MNAASILSEKIVAKSTEVQVLRNNYIARLKDLGAVQKTTFELDILNGLLYLEKFLTEIENCDSITNIFWGKLAKEEFRKHEPALKKYYFPKYECPKCSCKLEALKEVYGKFVNPETQEYTEVDYIFKVCSEPNCNYTNKDMIELICKKSIPKDWVTAEIHEAYCDEFYND